MDTVRARKFMVDSQVRPNDVPDIRLQRAMESLPREDFVPASHRLQAYVEKDIPLFPGRWLAKARDFSKLIQAANVQPTDLILDVGCGFGYSTAVLSRLGSVAVGLETGADAMARASEACADHGIDNVAFVTGPLAAGCPNQGPFDVIVIAGGVEAGFEGLLKQLRAEGGRLVTFVMQRGIGLATVFSRNGEAMGRRVVFEGHPAGTISGFNQSSTFNF